MKKPPALPCPLSDLSTYTTPPGELPQRKGCGCTLTRCLDEAAEEPRGWEKGKGEVPRELTKDFDLRRQNFDQKYLDGEPPQRG